ncbi:hypothetical protein RZ67_05515 [[Haemophilus] ducreyi]|nr:hypothetical protein RZ66_05590 [[Haemophilus] ducreyi]AKO47081.1 hypothetical protein RZ67_05515 [[Haemophilus] ducreyi]AKO48426.1 hypothetical protein RZ68_05500 [[Haemophilus] ducreyi]AKO49811.1 hypothetical protein RZ69_05525 [[Haemophilus] ducreyi]SEV92501.1 Phage protein (N4 Gp49/phage Sf6 gene 66) family protein [[Haemophilus] ducreyi]
MYQFFSHLDLLGKGYDSPPLTTTETTMQKLTLDYIKSLIVNADIGQKIAYDNAVEKIWQLEGYLAVQRKYEVAL